MPGGGGGGEGVGLVCVQVQGQDAVADEVADEVSCFSCSFPPFPFDFFGLFLSSFDTKNSETHTL